MPLVKRTFDRHRNRVERVFYGENFVFVVTTGDPGAGHRSLAIIG